jgi:hypothetical protein
MSGVLIQLTDVARAFMQMLRVGQHCSGTADPCHRRDEDSDHDIDGSGHQGNTNARFWLDGCLPNGLRDRRPR